MLKLGFICKDLEYLIQIKKIDHILYILHHGMVEKL